MRGFEGGQKRPKEKTKVRNRKKPNRKKEWQAWHEQYDVNINRCKQICNARK